MCFAESDLGESTSAASPGERLMVGRTPLLAEDRARKRQALREATEARLEPIAAATRREKRRCQGAGKSGERVGQGSGRYKMAKHVTWFIDEDGGFTSQRDEASSTAETRRDGLYGIHPSAVARPRRPRHGARRQAVARGGTGLPPPQPWT